MVTCLLAFHLYSSAVHLLLPCTACLPALPTLLNSTILLISYLLTHAHFIYLYPSPTEELDHVNGLASTSFTPRPPPCHPLLHCCLRVIYCHLRFAQVLPFYPMSHFLPQAAKLVVSTLQYQHLCFLHIYAAHKLLKHRKILNSKCSFTLHTINDVVVFPQYMRHLWY